MSCGMYKMNGGAKHVGGAKQVGGAKHVGGAKQVGGAAMAPLSYLNPTYREPSSSAGPHALYSEPGLARPSINATGGSRSRSRKLKCKRKHKHTRRCIRKGGFFPPPSLLGSFIQSAPTLAMPAAVSGYRLVRNYKGSNKTRKNH
jgi:hypothetical protein